MSSQGPASTGKGTRVFDSMEKTKQKPTGRSALDQSLQKKTKVLKKPKKVGYMFMNLLEFYFIKVN